MISSVTKRPGTAVVAPRTEPMKRVLLVDDDISLCNLLNEYLGRVGFEVESVHDGREAFERIFSGNYLAVVLDLMLPGIMGLDLLQQIRAKSNIPVLILTAQGEEIDRILGLEVGADDYLAKPFNPRELTARLNAVLRRSQGLASQSKNRFDSMKHADLLFDPAARAVRCANSVLHLTTAEFELLRVLLKNAGQVVSRDELAQDAFGRLFSPMDRSIDLHISHLRRKLGRFPDGSERIKAIRGVGYMCAYPAARPSD
jgi:two-component system, OmpR family, response regulator CpxR